MPRKRPKRKPVRYYSAKRRAVYARGEDIDSLTVFEEDGWVCRLCDKPISRYIRYPAWLCATLDHIIPLSLGGEHVRANVQTAHRICNERKGSTLDAADATC